MMSQPVTPDPTLDRIRTICLALPDAREEPSQGNPTFRAGKKTFALLDTVQGRRCLAFKATLEHQARLCSSARFLVAPHVGARGWTCMRLDGEVDWEQVRSLVEGSYKMVLRKHALDS